MGPFSIYDPQIEKTAAAWLAERSELFVERYLPYSGGSGDYIAIRSVSDLNNLIDQASPNSVIFISNQNMLPLRGIVDDDFIELAKNKITDGNWWVIVKPVFYPEDFTPIESGNTLVELQNTLDNFKEQMVWLGGDFTFPDTYWEIDDSPDALIIRKPEILLAQ
jgi:hypothetical protein